LAAALCQSLNSSSSAVLPCWCRAGSRAILKSIIILILHYKQHGSTAYFRRVYCMRCFHLAISIPVCISCLRIYVASSRDLAVLPCCFDVRYFC
jgi:hypothetical protein